jgi:hypothetical protein
MHYEFIPPVSLQVFEIFTAAFGVDKAFLHHDNAPSHTPL